MISPYCCVQFYEKVKIPTVLVGKTFPAQIIVKFYSAGEMQCSADYFCTSILDSVQLGNIRLIEAAIKKEQAIVNHRSDLLLVQNIQNWS